LPEGQGSLPWYKTVERRSARAELGPTDPHGVKGFSVHDVETTASIHQYLGEPRAADDGVNNKWILAWLRDAIRMVVTIESKGRSGPVEEGWRGWLNGVDLSVFQLALAPGVIGRRAAKDHEAVVDDRKVVILLLAIALVLLRLQAENITPLQFYLVTDDST
jgi:hypothetical protein